MESSGDLHQITAVPLAGEGLPVPLFALTSFPSALNVGPDGSLYLDQFNIGVHVLRFTETGGPPERIARSTGAFTGTGPLELPDGRVLFSSVASGRTRLLAALRGQEAVPFVQTDEDTSGPTALIGNDSVAFFMGSPPDIAIAIASADGRIQRRLGAHFTEFPGSLAASPDGRTLFYAESGFVWAIEIAGGDARKLHVGDAVTVTPDGKSLIVQLMVGEASRLLLLPISGGEPVEIPVLGKNYLAPNPIAGRSVRADGRIALPLQAPDSWFWRPGVLNRHTGAVLRVPLEFDGDVIKMNWAGDGSLLALGWEYKTDLWRFRPAVPRTDF